MSNRFSCNGRIGRLLLSGVAVATGLLSLVSAPAFAKGADTEKPSAQTLIVVQRLHDAGGLPAPEKDKPALNDALTTGIIHYLTDHKQGFGVWDARSREPLKPAGAQKHLSLVGDLSRVAGDTPKKDIYLLTIRLCEEGDNRRILAQWSGRARSLLYLTNNLRNDNRFSSDGLVGEMGGRIALTAQAYAIPSREEQQKLLARVMATLKTPAPAFKVDVVADEVQAANGPAPAVNAPPPPATERGDKQKGNAPRLLSGEPYHLSIQSDSDAEILVFSHQEGGLYEPLSSMKEGKELHAVHGTALALPSQGVWRAPQANAGKPTELVVLQHLLPVRKAEERTATNRLRLASLPAAETGVIETGVIETGVIETLDLPNRKELQGIPSRLGMEAEDEQDVQVINAGNSLLPHSTGDTSISRLAARIQLAPQEWRIIRIKLDISSRVIHKVALLAIGIDNYSQIPRAKLAFARRDAERMGQFWREAGAQTQILLDANATRREIIDSWNRLLANAQPTDMIVLHWSGHSLPDKEGALLPSSDSVLADKKTLIPLKDLIAPVAQSKAACVLFFLDMCNIGQENEDTSETEHRLFTSLEQSKASTAVGIFGGLGTATGEDSALKSGLLTHALLKALQKQSQSNRSCTFTGLSQAANAEIKAMQDASKIKAVDLLYGEDFAVFPDTMPIKK